MAVKIRLMRMGKKKQPTYRVVVADARSPRDGRFIEIIGKYGPRQEPSLFEIDGDRALRWLHQGAQPTEQVQRLLTQSGVWERYQSAKGAGSTGVGSRGAGSTGAGSRGAGSAGAAPADAPAPGDAPAPADAPAPEAP